MTAIEWLVETITSKHDKSFKEFYKAEIEQAKEMEKQKQEDFVIGFAEWLTNEKSEYSVMYGNQEKRFATFNEDFTIKELLEIYKKEKEL